MLRIFYYICGLKLIIDAGVLIYHGIKCVKVGVLEPPERLIVAVIAIVAVGIGIFLITSIG